MKKVINIAYILVATVALYSCTQDVDYKAVREEVIFEHDKLMEDESRMMNVKMKLDTLAATGIAKLNVEQPALDTTKTRADVAQLTAKLNAATDQMSKWMESFQTDVQGKSNLEAVAYFENEKIKVHKLDSVYRSALDEAEAYLNKFGIKVDGGGHAEYH